MLLPHAQREANPPCPQFFQALPTAQGHWNGASRLCKGYRDHKTAQQRNCRWRIPHNTTKSHPKTDPPKISTDRLYWQCWQEEFPEDMQDEKRRVMLVKEDL